MYQFRIEAKINEPLKQKKLSRKGQIPIQKAGAIDKETFMISNPAIRNPMTPKRKDRANSKSELVFFISTQNN